MSQLTIYLDDESIRKIENAAALEKSSVSKWVKNRLIQSLENQWPTNYFGLFGSLAENDLPAVSKLDFSQDAARESL
jgi:hypothetical protein